MNTKRSIPYLFRHCLYLVLGLTVLGVQAADPLRVAITGTSRPFSYIENETLSGFNVDLSKTICEMLQRECLFIIKPFPQIIPMLENHQADIAVANYLYTAERAKKMRFSTAYWRSTSSFIAPKAEPTTQQNVCVIQKTRQHDYMIRNYPKATLKLTTSTAGLLSTLAEGGCNKALLPTLQALPFLQGPQGKEYHFIGQPLHEEGLGGDVHIGVDKDQPELQQALNRALDELFNNGRYEVLMLRYFPFSIR